MESQENTNSTKSPHFYANLIAACNNEMLVCLAYNIYKREKIKVIDQHRASGVKDSRISAKMKEWQSTECHKVDLYITQANETYKKSMKIALEQPSKELAEKHAEFKKNMNHYCPQKSKRRTEFFWSVLSSFVSWVLTVILIIIGWMAFTPKGIAAKVLSLFSE